MSNEKSSSAIPPGPDWNPAPPEHIPAPTIWPAAISLGATLLAWGLITSYLLSIAGGLLSVIAMGGWIRDIRHERAR